MNEFDLISFNYRLINFLEKKENLTFFRDECSGEKGIASEWFVLFFRERYEDDLIEVRCDNVMIMFFTETDEGRRLMHLLQSEFFDSDDDAFSASRSVFKRIIERV